MPRGDQFHNGHEVLPAVTEWHNYLRKGMRNEDRITPQLLELIDNRMLVVNPEKRIKAEDLCSELDRILKTSIASTEIQLSEQFLRLLGEVDQEESVWAGETRQSQHLVQASSSSGKTITGSRRPFRAERPRVTTHRSSIWPSQKSTSKAGGSLGRQVIHMQTLTERATASVSNPEPPQTPSNHRGRASSGFGHVKLVNRSQRSSSVRKHVSQNYFQALEEQKGREKSSPFKFLNGKGNTSDPVLASYFNERDIVSYRCFLLQESCSTMLGFPGRQRQLNGRALVSSNRAPGFTGKKGQRIGRKWDGPSLHHWQTSSRQQRLSLKIQRGHESGPPPNTYTTKNPYRS